MDNLFNDLFNITNVSTSLTTPLTQHEATDDASTQAVPVSHAYGAYPPANLPDIVQGRQLSGQMAAGGNSAVKFGIKHVDMPFDFNERLPDFHPVVQGAQNVSPVVCQPVSPFAIDDVHDKTSTLMARQRSAQRASAPPLRATAPGTDIRLPREFKLHCSTSRDNSRSDWQTFRLSAPQHCIAGRKLEEADRDLLRLAFGTGKRGFAMFPEESRSPDGAACSRYSYGIWRDPQADPVETLPDAWADVDIDTAKQARYCSVIAAPCDRYPRGHTTQVRFFPATSTDIATDMMHKRQKRRHPEKISDVSEQNAIRVRRAPASGFSVLKFPMSNTAAQSRPRTAAQSRPRTASDIAGLPRGPFQTSNHALDAFLTYMERERSLRLLAIFGKIETVDNLILSIYATLRYEQQIAVVKEFQHEWLRNGGWNIQTHCYGGPITDDVTCDVRAIAGAGGEEWQLCVERFFLDPKTKSNGTDFQRSGLQKYFIVLTSAFIDFIEPSWIEGEGSASDFSLVPPQLAVVNAFREQNKISVGEITPLSILDNGMREALHIFWKSQSVGGIGLVVNDGSGTLKARTDPRELMKSDPQTYFSLKKIFMDENGAVRQRYMGFFKWVEKQPKSTGLAPAIEAPANEHTFAVTHTEAQYPQQHVPYVDQSPAVVALTEFLQKEEKKN